jgi:hypothetical protein
MVALFQQIAALDQELLAVPFGAEREAVPLLAQRGQLVAMLEATSVPVAQAAELMELQASTVAVQSHFAHFRRRLAAEIGESGSHRQFLETLADSLEPAAWTGEILA